MKRSIDRRWDGGRRQKEREREREVQTYRGDTAAEYDVLEALLSHCRCAYRFESLAWTKMEYEKNRYVRYSFWRIFIGDQAFYWLKNNRIGWCKRYGVDGILTRGAL